MKDQKRSIQIFIVLTWFIGVLVWAIWLWDSWEKTSWTITTLKWLTERQKEKQDFPYGKDQNWWAYCDISNKEPWTWDDLRNYGDWAISGWCIVPPNDSTQVDQVASEATWENLKTAIKSPETPRLESSNRSKIVLVWEPVSWAEWYNVSRDGEYLATVNSWTQYTDQDIIPGKIYSYQISAYAKNIYSPNSEKLKVKAAVGKADNSTAPESPSLDWLGDYSLAFFDEFNGSALDINKWNTAFLWWPDLTINEEEQYYVDRYDTDQNLEENPFSFRDGSLVITAQEILEKDRWTYNNKKYTSGIITSYDAFKFTHGYAEARLKLPKWQWLWPAFWLLNAYYREGLMKPEIDIMENLWHEPHKMYQTYHYFDPEGKMISTENHTEAQDFSESFHRYWVLWEPWLIQYYIDGMKTHTIRWEMVASEEMYVLANLAVWGSWPGSPDETTPFPAEYMIDWIRVYQKNQ